MRAASITGMCRETGKWRIGLDHLRQSIMDILLTPVGARVCNREYGSRLPELIDTPLNDAGLQSIYAASAMAITQHYPVIAIDRIAIENDGSTPHHRTITIQGHERGPSPDQANMVDTRPAIELRLPFNLNAPILGPVLLNERNQS